LSDFTIYILVFANGVAIFQPDYLAKLEQVTNEQMAPPTETANPTEGNGKYNISTRENWLF